MLAAPARPVDQPNPPVMTKPTASWRPFLWVPSLYLAMGIPFNVINGTASTMYKSLGVSDSQITGALGSIVVAWSFKPLWAAFLDMYRTKKFFVITMEVLLAVLFVGVAMSLPLPGYFQISIALLWVAAFASSTQDICGDGIYLTALDKPAQAGLAGVQGMFWNLGKVLATGALVSSMELLSKSQGWPQQKMWMAIWILAACSMVVFAVYHIFLLPAGSIEDRPASAKQVWNDFLETATTFFHKRAFWGMIAFVFFYRIGEGLILTEGKLFLQSSLASGGLGLSAGQVSNIDAIWGTLASIIGGILGGIYLSKKGLTRSLLVLGLCLNIPHFTFVFLSHYAAAGHGLSYSTIALLVSIEKFGYGFGFIGNMVYMMQQIAPGRSTMTHYAFATALMNLMLVPTTMISGPLAEKLGYSTFFLVVMFASIPSVLAAWRAPFPIKDNDHTSAEGSATKLVTVDDHTRLSVGERTMQLLAGRASIFAMLNILTILVVDMNLVSYLIDTATGRHENWGFITRLFSNIFGASALLAFFGLLIVSAVLKGYFSLRTFQIAGTAAQEVAKHAEQNYFANVRGAKVATLMCAAGTLAVLAFGAHMAF